MTGSESRTDEPIDPIEFLRRALAISPEDAAQVREDAAKRAPETERRGNAVASRTPSEGDKQKNPAHEGPGAL